jgi:hypothetical protein
LRDFESQPIKLWIDNASYEVNYFEASTGFNRGGAMYIANAEGVYFDLVPFRDQLCRTSMNDSAPSYSVSTTFEKLSVAGKLSGAR